MFYCAPDGLTISSSLSCIFSGALIHSFIWAIFFISAGLLHSKGQSLRYSPGQGNPLGCFLVLYVGEGSEREHCHLLSSLLAFSHFLHHPQSNWALLVLIPGGWFCIHSRTLWVSPMNSPVRLGVSPTATTHTGFFSQRFWGFISAYSNPGLHSLSFSAVVPSSLSTHKCGTSWSASCCHLPKSSSHCLAGCPLCLSPPPLLFWINIALTPWLSDFHAVWFSGSSGCLLFLNFLLYFFWLCEKA